MMNHTEYFGTEKVWKILLKLAPPVMFAQLIQALYNIVDSFFIGKYAETGLTALSIIYPIQLLMIAIGVGTGVGVNTVMAKYYGLHKREQANEVAGVGTFLAVFWWVIAAAFLYFFLPLFAVMSTDSEEVISYIVVYGRIISVFSFGLFLESVWTKVHQAAGDMKNPMIAQIVGAVVNIILDPILIFGKFGISEMGIQGAAIATVIGQCVAAGITFFHGYVHPPELKKWMRHVREIYLLGIPNILMQCAYTVYIFGLNMVLAGFSNQAVTALGLYYKWQTFFFIPLGGLQTCIVPILSYNHAKGNLERCKKILWNACLFGAVLMLVGVISFEGFPVILLKFFSKDDLVITIGAWAFRIIALSFVPMSTSLIFPVFFQALGNSGKSILLTIVRTIVLFVPVGYVLSRFSLQAFWFTFPITEIVTSMVGYGFYRKWKQQMKDCSY